MGKFLTKAIAALAIILALNVLQTFAQTPVLSSFSPAKGPVGSVVTLTGSNFNPIADNNAVFFGATRGRIISASATSISVEVPAGATFQFIALLNIATGLTGYSAYPFHTTFPTKRAIYAMDFDARSDYVTDSKPNCVALGDLDGDGKTDMIVSNAASNSISIYQSTAVPGVIGAATFNPRFNITTSATPVKINITDIDGDGNPDIIVLTAAGLEIFKNNAVPTVLNPALFAPGVNYPLSGSAAAISVTDFDGDGKPDIGIAYASPTRFSTAATIMRNTTTKGIINTTSFANPFPIYAEFGNFSITAADLTGDDKPEIILMHTASRVLRVYKNNAVPGTLNINSFAPNLSFATAINPASINIGDMDADNLPDMQTSNYGNIIGAGAQDRFFLSILLRRNFSNDIVTSSFTSEKNFVTGRVALSSALGDIDGDGLLDPVNVNYLDGTISVRRNASTPNNVNFNTTINLPALNNPNDIKVADMDGDGKPDIIFTNLNSNTVSIYRNNAASQESITFPNLLPVVYGASDFAPGATSNKPNIPIIYTSSNPAVATITAAGQIHITGAGSTIITANQDGSETFPAATPVSRTLLVLRAPLTISAQNYEREYGADNPPLTLKYTGLVYNDTAPLPGNTVDVSTTATATSLPGKYPVNVTGSPNSANYDIKYENGILTIGKLKQTILFTTPGQVYFGDPGFALNASASSGLPITFTADNPNIITITGNFAQPQNTGTVNITATQAGSDIYESASSTTQLTILPGKIVIVSNTITPNGDGINDYWVIAGLDPGSGRVTIFNRMGEQVFQSRGYPVPFNGTRNGTRLPGGVYYYLIDFFDGRKPISGSLTIVY